MKRWLSGVLELLIFKMSGLHMRLLYFSDAVLIIVNIIAWFLIHMSIAYVGTRIPASFFSPSSILYRKKKWEDHGQWYQKYLKIKSWKNRLPDGAILFAGGFSKGKIAQRNPEYLSLFVKETCRGEFVHWIVFILSPAFFIWNPPWVGLIMILYAFIANIPCIIAQRYNRFHLETILSKSFK